MKLIFSTLALGLIFAATASAEMVDNPDYLHWSQFKPGSSSTLAGKTTMGEGEQQMVIDSRRGAKLISIDDKEAVVEQSIITEVPGFNMPPMVTKIIIPAKVEAGNERDMLNPETKLDSGEETLEIDGKRYQAKWVEYRMTEQGVSMIAKSWYADEVPGRQIKMIATGDGEMKFKSDLELSAVEVK